MLPVALVTQSQALPLLLLPLAMAAAHPDAGARRHHVNAHVQTVSATPMLYPVNAMSCSQSVEHSSGDRYDIIIDPKHELSGPDGIRGSQ